MKKIYLKSYLNKNLGDDLFVDLFCKRYGEDAQIYIDNRKYKFMNKRNKNAKIISNILSSFYNKILIKINKFQKITSNKYVKKADALVILGGSMFIESNDNNIYEKMYENYYNINKNYYIVGANFGPYKTNEYLNKYSNIFSNAKDVCLRDQKSYDIFSKLKNVRYAPDIIFSYKKYMPVVTEKKQIFISVINLSNRMDLKSYQSEYESTLLEIIKYYQSNGYKVILSSFCKAEGDEEAIDRIYAQLIEVKKVNKLYYDGNIDEILTNIVESEIIFGTRFHSIILGFIANKYVLPIIYSKKTLSMLEDINFEGKYIDIKNTKDIDYKISSMVNQNQRLKNINEISNDADEQFELLDKYIKN